MQKWDLMKNQPLVRTLKKNLQLYRIGETKGFEMKTMARKTI